MQPKLSHASGTPVLAGDGSPSDQAQLEAREDHRYRTVLQAARLICETAQSLCVVRDISQSGMKARVFGTVITNERVCVEFKGGRTAFATTKWVEDRLAGFEFDEAVDLTTIFAAARPGFAFRSPRLEVAAFATMCVGRSRLSLPIADISVSGIRLFGGEYFMRNEDVGIDIDGLEKREGTVLWKRHGHIGVVFEQQLSLEALSTWASERRFHRVLADLLEDPTAKQLTPA